MNRNNLLYVFILFIFTVSGLFDIPGFGQPLPAQISQKAPLKEDQILYNGKVWHNQYNNVKGDQFLFSKEYLQGSLTIDGKLYNNLSISYDIYNDEIITPSNNGSILQLNKEMVDSFTLVFEFKTYMFKNTLEDSLTGVKGFVNVLYKGESALYVKYKKEIQLLAVDDKYDLFIESFHIYFLKDGIVHQLNNKGDLLKILYQDKAQIKDFIKKNKLKISKKVPESFVPVIRHYDSISH
jgi:hypothetical protein